jgi:hypothetical protein
MTQALGYLNAAWVKPRGRGATQWAPAYGNVPLSTTNGFYIPKYPQAAPRLDTTIFNLTNQGATAGFNYQSPVLGVPLSDNPYATGM